MSSGSSSTPVAPAEHATPGAAPSTSSSPQSQPPYHVVLMNDDDHTYEYVIEMLGKLFGHDEMRAFVLAREVDTTGRAVVDTTTLERAELKRDQIHGYGADPRIARCRGGMTALIQAAR
jgi:ATP-dependent Clp protease adaptor protein ClpS